MRNLFFIIMSVMLFSSCVTEKKARNYYRVHPEKLAEICSDTYPPEVKYIPGKPVYLKGDSTVVIDTVTITVDCPDGSKVVKDCPPNKTTRIRDTILITDTLEVISTQALATIDKMGNQVAVLQSKYDKMVEKSDLLKESNKEKTKWNWILGGSLVALVGYRVFRMLRVV